MGLSVVSGGIRQGPVLRGSRGGFFVEVSRRRALPFAERRFTWRVDVRFVSLSVRTAMRVWPRGPSLSAALQGTNVTTGDPSLDERFLLWGSAPDLTRAVIEEPCVRTSLEDLHRAALLLEIALHPVGSFEVRASLLGPSDDDPSGLIEASVRLARALEDVADASPVERRPLDRQGTGGASGAPIVIPTSL